jgi:MFS family permease
MTISPLLISDFRLYLIVRFCSRLGNSAIMIIVAWQAYSIARQTMDTHQASAILGLIGLAQFLPILILTPISGWVADKYDRRIITGLTSTLLLFCSSILTLATYEGWITLSLIFAIAVALGIARCFTAPAQSALLPAIVPRDLLPRAIAFSSIAWQIATIIGPAMGGILYATKTWLPYAMASGMFLVALISNQQIAKINRMPMETNRHPIRQMIDGLTYVRSNRLVMGTITLDLMAVLFAGATALLPVYARDILHVGSLGLGFMAAAPGVGAVLAAALLSARPITHDIGNKMLIGVAIFGLASAIFGLTAFLPPPIAFPVALTALFVCGSSDMVSVFVRHSLIQIYTPDEMRGRVSSVSLLTISASNELGETESGLLASVIGPVATVVLGGIGAILVTIVWAKIFPELGQAKSFDMQDVNAVNASGGKDMEKTT